MANQIVRTAGALPFDAIPTYKITRYPLEEGWYKPFAQGQLVLAGEELVARLWAFEAAPERRSALALCLEPAPGRALAVGFSADGDAWCFIDGRPAPSPGRITPLGGEDLQGIYWGGMIHLGLGALEEALGEPARLQRRARLNLYKLLERGERPHLGAAFDFDPRKDLWAPGQLAAFSVEDF